MTITIPDPPMTPLGPLADRLSPLNVGGILLLAVLGGLSIPITKLGLQTLPPVTSRAATAPIRTDNQSLGLAAGRGVGLNAGVESGADAPVESGSDASVDAGAKNGCCHIAYRDSSAKVRHATNCS